MTIVYVDTENIGIRGLDCLKDYLVKSKAPSDTPIHCYGISQTPLNRRTKAWLEATKDIPGVHWHMLQGKREKQMVDQAIINDIRSLILSPQIEDYDSFIIISSDADYLRSIKKLKRAGKHTVVIGYPVGSARVKCSCHEYINC